ncbi:MAG: DegT/DnrJ/EryC1/StrS aminotransferase family protein [Spirochaetaceae bacterium]|nr:DegT/DnrJ/EryC1/StrS aminotransferase family protein [Spirochaetaceae bacterium]
MSKALRTKGEESIVFSRCPLNNTDSPVQQMAENLTSPYKFAYSRTALKYGLKTIDFKEGDELLVPDFICESAIEPLLDLNIIPRYYPVNSALEPEWNKLEKLVNTSTIALLIVHYFGNPQPVDKFLELCNTHSLLLIEDNAHGFGAKYHNRLLGTIGDIGFCSPRKSFPISNGSYLYLSNNKTPDLSTLILRPSATISSNRNLQQKLKQFSPFKQILEKRRNIHEYNKRKGPSPPYGSQSHFRDPHIEKDYAMDNNSHKYLESINLEKIREIRQEIYHLWQRWAITQGLTPVFPTLSPEAMPLIFPAYSSSLDNSLQWFERGHRCGVDIHSWPTLPMEIVKENKNAMRLWERLVCFPIHQNMNLDSLKRRLNHLKL